MSFALPSFANPLAAIVALALAAPVVGGCALQGEGEAPASNAKIESITQAVGGVPLEVAAPSTALTIVNGLVTAYGNLDNLAKYGTANIQPLILGELNRANRELAVIRATQEHEFLQVKTDLVIGDLNKLENKIDFAWTEYENAQMSGTTATFVPSALTWVDAADMMSDLQGQNGTSNAFQLIAEKMKASGGETDPLGKYAVRMRTRLAQVAFLLTRTGAMTPSEAAKYQGQLAQLEASFVKATRWYFLQKAEAVEATTGISTRCITRIFEGWVYTTGSDRAVSSESYFDEGTLGSQGGGFTKCEVGRKNFQAVQAAPLRAAMVNTIYSQQKVFVQSWTKSTNTLVVTRATYQSGSDVQKAVALMCNSRETCSFPAASFANRLGSNANLPAGTLSVDYRCAGEATDRQAMLLPGKPAEAESANSSGRAYGVASLVPGYADALGDFARVAMANVSVLLLGESGTGKEVLASAAHTLSGRRGPFVPVNCGALTATLVESQLFTFDLPPSRERGEDLGVLVAELLQRAAGERAASSKLSPEAGRALLAHDWPLNVRELNQAL